MTSWINYLNPAYWATAVSNSFISQLENGLLYVLSVFLNAILGISSDIGSSISLSLEDTMYLIISISESLGPFGLPVVIIGLIGLIGFLILVFQVIKDVPVVGALM